MTANSTSWGSLTTKGKYVQIPQQTVTQYQFEDNSDQSLAVDSIGSNDGNIFQSSYDNTSRCGELALNSGSTDSYISSQSSIDLVSNGDVEACAIGCFVKSNGNVEFDTPISWRNDGNNKLRIYESSSNTWAIQFQVNGVGEIIESSESISTSSYQHIAASLTQNEIVLYVDGDIVSSTTHSQDITGIGSGTYYVATRNGTNNFFDGLYDNITFANDRFTETDIVDLINQC